MTGANYDADLDPLFRLANSPQPKELVAESLAQGKRGLEKL